MRPSKSITSDQERSASPNSTSQVMKSCPFKKEALVGKMWEIYWSPADVHSTSPSLASSDEDEESEFGADWYNAHVKSYIPNKDVYEVAFVGEENVYEMKLDDNIVRPLDCPMETYELSQTDEKADIKLDETSPQHEIDVNWANDLVGCDVEVYWDCTNSDSGFSSDWYNAHVVSFDLTKGLHEVAFDGEEQRYMMVLDQSNLRMREYDQAWIDSIIGRKMEVYWEISDSDFPADWYDAEIISFDIRTGIFKLSFVGEEGYSMMKLTKDNVRIPTPEPIVTPAWIDQLLGKQVEIYWENTNNDEHEDSVSDWYEAKILSFHHDTELCKIFFVGGEEDCMMKLSETKVRLPVPKHNVKPAWIEYLVGRDVEVFWESTDDSHNSQAFPSDWYDGAFVDSFDPYTSQFKVSFLGEKKFYMMNLTESNVRPSTRAWVRRTSFLLDLGKSEDLYSGRNVLLTAKVLESLPHGSESYEQKLEPYPYLPSDEFSMEMYQYLLQLQLEHVEKIIFNTVDESPAEMKKKTFTRNSTQHINHLIQGIRLMMEAHESSKFLESYLSKNYDSDKLKLENMHAHFRDGLNLLMMSLVFDCERRPTESIQKRKVKTNFSFQSKRVKKRKVSSTQSAFGDFNNSDSEKEMLSEQILPYVGNSSTSWSLVWNSISSILGEGNVATLSPELVHMLCSLFSPTQFVRFASYAFGESLSSIIEKIWGRLQNWLDKCLEALGQTFAEAMSVECYFKKREPEAEFFSPNSVRQALDEAQNGEILKKVDLSKYIDFMKYKMDEVRSFQDDAWVIILRTLYASVRTNSNVSHEINIEFLEKGDEVIQNLQNIQSDIRCPKECNYFSLQTVMKAIVCRRNFILRQHIANHRERLSLVEKCLREEPQQLPIPDKFKNHVFLKFQIEHKKSTLLEKSLGKMKESPKNVDWNRIECQSSCDDLARDLERLPLISEDEEKALILSGILDWGTKVKAISLDSTNLTFESVNSLHSHLQSLLKGRTEKRDKLSRGLICDYALDMHLGRFASEQISLRFQNEQLFILRHFEQAFLWKKKVTDILTNLRSFKHPKVDGFSCQSVKYSRNNMVELMVLEDLLNEHELSEVDQSDYASILYSIKTDAEQWLSKCMTRLPLKSRPIRDHVALLRDIKSLRDSRPKGLLMFPSRAIMNDWIDILEWYDECHNIFEKHRILEAKRSDLNAEAFHFEEKNLHEATTTLFIRGAAFHSHNKSIGIPTFSRLDIRSLVNVPDFDSSKICQIEFEKIQHSQYFTSLHERLLDYDDYLGPRGISFLLKIWAWRNETISILSNVQEKNPKKRFTHVHGKRVLELAKSLPQAFSVFSESDSFLNSLYRRNFLPIERIVHKGDMILDEIAILRNELAANNVLITSETLEQNSVMLRNVRSNLKTCNTEGLVLENHYLSLIEKHIREVNWLRNIYANPILKDRRGADNINVSTSRVPSTTIFQYIEKAPSRCKTIESDESSLSYELQAAYKRLSKIKDQITKWQDDVQNYLPRALRLSKRKVGQERSLAFTNLQDLDIVTEFELQGFLQDPVLKYVSMNEEVVIQEASVFTSFMAERMLFIFGEDHQGFDLDRCKIPEFPSLLGINGEFYLQRLIKSAAFAELKKELDSMETFANSLPVKTVDKITYHWILEAVKWVEKVASALHVPVSEEIQFEQSFISLEDSIALINEGSKLFFEMPSESKKYLLAHRLSISARASTGRIHVKNCKGGSNHSIGCSVLRWLAFCYNGMRNDLATSEYWIKRCESILKKRTDDILVYENLFLEVRNHLIIVPPMQLLLELRRVKTSIQSTTKERDHSEEEAVGQFNHDLIIAFKNEVPYNP